MMKEEWLPAGDITRQWYLAHLVDWYCVCVGLAFHVLMGVKVGGVTLLASMLNWYRRPEDGLSWLQGAKLKHADGVVKVVEIVVIGGIILAFYPAYV
jgi:hypothetical protein